MAARVEETLPTDVLVVELIEARCRRLMAERAALPDAWPHRGKRAELGQQIQVALDQWLGLRS